MINSKQTKTEAQKLFKLRATRLEKAMQAVMARPEHANAVAPSYTRCREAIAQAAGFKNASTFDRAQQDLKRSAETLRRLNEADLEYASRLMSHLYAECGMQVAQGVLKELGLVGKTEHGGTIFPTIRTTEQSRGLFNFR